MSLGAAIQNGSTGLIKNGQQTVDTSNEYGNMRLLCGGVAERLNAPVLKTGVG